MLYITNEPVVNINPFFDFSSCRKYSNLSEKNVSDICNNEESDMPRLILGNPKVNDHFINKYSVAVSFTKLYQPSIKGDKLLVVTLHEKTLYIVN